MSIFRTQLIRNIEDNFSSLITHLEKEYEIVRSGINFLHIRTERQQREIEELKTKIDEIIRQSNET